MKRYMKQLVRLYHCLPRLVQLLGVFNGVRAALDAKFAEEVVQKLQEDLQEVRDLDSAVRVMNFCVALQRLHGLAAPTVASPQLHP